MWFIKNLLIIFVSALLLVSCSEDKEPTKATSSAYNQDIRRATTSIGLTKADLAWH